MTRTDTNPSRSPGLGLRIRLWIGCLAGSLLAAGAIAFLLAHARNLPAGLDPEFRWVWLPGILGATVVLSIGLALWLDRGIVRHLRGLARGLEGGQIAELRGLPSSSGWGELSELTLRAEAILARHRQLGKAGAELVRLRERLGRIHHALELWSKVGTWEPLPAGGATEVGTAALAPLVGILNRELARVSLASAAGREGLNALKQETTAALDEVREVAEQSERGFVEATALLTTVRELERLSGELDATLAAPNTAAEDRARAARESLDRFRSAAADAIGRLVSASIDSVVHLANGMQRMQEIADQTHVIANRATLIALHAMTGRTASAEPGSALAEELKSLAREVREASERVSTLTAGIENEAAKARERMASVRAEVATVLDSVPVVEAPASGEAATDSTRLMERVREMIRDAAAKGERLSSAGERVSSAAVRLQRRIDSEAESVARLVAVLSGRSNPSDPPSQQAAIRYLKMIDPHELPDEGPGAGRSEDSESDQEEPGSGRPEDSGTDEEERA